MSIIITWMIYFGTCIMQRILCKLLFWCGSELGAWIRVGRRPNRGRFGGPQISRTRPSRSESNCLLRYWRLYNDTLNSILFTYLGVFITLPLCYQETFDTQKCQDLRYYLNLFTELSYHKSLREVFYLVYL